MISSASPPAQHSASTSVASRDLDAGSAVAKSSDDPSAAASFLDSTAGAPIRRMLPRVERLRGLRASRDVPGVAVDRPTLMARIRQHVARDLPPEAIRNEGRELELLGFLPIGFAYEAAEYRLLEDQLAGYYEPADHTMYLASDLAEQDADATLAHELVHALQDQNWDLDELSRYRPGESDVAEAISALAEGDATSAMLDYVIESTAPRSGKHAPDLPDEVCTEQFRQGLERGRASSLPHVMTSSLIAPYQYGTVFVNALRRVGGWPAVNEAWRVLPTTTEQVLHIDKWLSHEPAIKVRPPPFASLGSGWHVIDEDTEGELGTRIAFEQWIGEKAAEECSSHWGGDRGVLVERGDRTAFAWRLRYDAGTPSLEHSARAFPILAAGLVDKLGPATMRTTEFVCHERPERGPLALAVDRSDLLLVAGPAGARPPGESLNDATCSLARSWIHEIEAAR
jgi:hypothetical protein